MAKMSMIFMPSLRKSHFLGAPANLRMYSMVNHMMQTTSSMASLGLSVGSPLSSTPAIDGIVLSVIPIVETIMKEMEMKLTTLAAKEVSDFSIRSHKKRMYPPHLVSGKTSGSSFLMLSNSFFISS